MALSFSVMPRVFTNRESVRFQWCIEGKGNETIARLLHESEVLIPMAYWRSKELERGGKKTQPNPYK